MFLKRIVLNGFKSFADRTELDFGPGITGIVGPNGCGKSNVLDAVRWVLGSQSAKALRGGKMTDVVFAGSRSRKPANFAEVQLTFDNRGHILRSDDEEVTVSRLLYRSGESEYRLNGKSCRLKDIRELLLDTGVGVDAYSVIEQGRVDSLLQASPIERREIFEEAAGISRYKVRRIEAQRKLERTQNNLLRLQDIIEELERRLRSVRLAAGKARNFQQYDARLRELRSSFSMAEYHELEKRRQEIQHAAEELKSLVEQLRGELAGRDAEVSELEHQRQTLDDEIQEADASLLELQTALSALSERIAQGERRLPELSHTRERRQQQVGEIADRVQALSGRMEAERASLERLMEAERQRAGQIAEIESARKEAESQRDVARKTLEDQRVAVFEAARQSALLQNEQENLGQQHQRLSAQAERLETRQRDVSSQREALAGQLGEAVERVSRLEGQIDEFKTQLDEDQGRLSAFQQEADELGVNIGAAKEERSGIASRLGVLADMERRLEGVDQGTREVLEWRGDDEGRSIVCGLVADVLQIDDPRVGLLQPILATFENHVVVNQASGFLEGLAARGPTSGPVRILALDQLWRDATPLRYDHVPGYVARVADWVRCDSGYRNLAEHLLGRVFVVQEMDDALRLAADAPSGCVFVTLSGETVSADGRLTVGAGREAGGLISRKAEIRQLESEQEQVEHRLVQLTRRRMEVDEAISDAQLRRDDLLGRIASHQREHAEACNQRSRVQDEDQRLQGELENLGREIEGLRRSADEITQSLERLQAERASVDEAQREQQGRIDELAAAMNACEETVSRLSQQYTEALVERGRATEKRTAAEEAFGELEQRHAGLIAERETAEREVEEIGAQMARVEAELAEARSRQEVDEGRCRESQQHVYSLREKRQQLRERVEACGAEARAVQKRLEESEGALHEQEVALRENEVRRENLLARVREELDLDLAERYAEYEHAEQDWEAIKEEIADLRGKIARLGNVNLDAITELEELTPRYEHLESQRNDLVSSVERLEKLIAELDTESRTRFSETFSQVRENFRDMFRKLFGGGKADIVLEDPENPLECGIEIIARPPGKEPQSISLLSGGEKTLTAVGLLLAVFKSRPSPFAILDEVDAALDESNVGRFNSVLQEFLSHSQFVVITHSKRTMAGADVLYGVTMEEAGVSKRVSVRFDDRVSTPSVA